MPITFTKAVKHEAKGRIALIGPAGSGKSFTMLTAAKALAGPNGKIAAIDTEQGSLEKYADQFDFDVCPLSEFTAPHFLEALHAAEKAGYAVFCCDSLSHFWMGKGGALEFVDAASQRSRNNDTFAGWKEFRPYEREMTDAMISSPCHIICTMRTKTAYEEQINPKTGKKQRVKIGLAPVQRDGLEYEFDLVGSMTEENCFVVDKTRCSSYAGKAIEKPKEKDFSAFAKWLSGAPREEATENPTKAPAKKDTAGVGQGSPQTQTSASGDQGSTGKSPESQGPTEEDRANWAKAFEDADTLEKFNEQIIPFSKERFNDPKFGKPFTFAMAAEAKKRGWVPDRTNGQYRDPAVQQ